MCREITPGGTWQLPTFVSKVIPVGDAASFVEEGHYAIVIAGGISGYQLWPGGLCVINLKYSTGMCREITPGGTWQLPTFVSKVIPRQQREADILALKTLHDAVRTKVLPSHTRSSPLTQSATPRPLLKKVITPSL
jgi:hypothetical protein